MMTQFRNLIYIVFYLVVFLSGCKEKIIVSPFLREADFLVQKYPDSALSVLEYYCEPDLGNIKKINNSMGRAKYALLYSQALDEIRIYIKNDSIIRIALDYYNSYSYARLCKKAAVKDHRSGKSDIKICIADQDSMLLDKAKAFYYYGRILENRGKFKEAIVAYLDAAVVLGSLNSVRTRPDGTPGCEAEDYLKGRIYGVLAGMLYEQHSLKDALGYYRLAVQAYENIGDIRKLMLMTERKAIVQYLLNNYQGALGDYNSAIRYAGMLNDTSKIISLSRGMAALVFHFTGDIKLTKEILIDTSEKYGYVLEYRDYPLLASVYLKERRIARARFFFGKSLEKETNYTPHQKVGMYSVGASIEAATGNYAKAYEYSRKMAFISDSLNKNTRDNLVVELIQEYNNRQLDIEKAVQEQKYGYISIIYMLVIIISGLIIVGAVIIILAHRDNICRKNKEIEEYLQQLNAIEESRNNIMEKLDSHIEKEALLKELLQTRFAEVKELARTYYEYGYSKNLQKKVEEILSVQLLHGESFEIIEKVVNAQKEGAISKIRREFPGIKEDYIKLLCLIYSGFSPQEICAVLNDTPQNIYVKKYRLKSKLAEFIKSNSHADF